MFVGNDWQSPQFCSNLTRAKISQKILQHSVCERKCWDQEWDRLVACRPCLKSAVFRFPVVEQHLRVVHLEPWVKPTQLYPPISIILSRMSYIWSSPVFRKLNTHPRETLTSECSVEILRGSRLNNCAVSLVRRCWIPFALHSTSSRTLSTLRHVPEWSRKPMSPSRDPITGQSETNLMLDGQDADRFAKNITERCSSCKNRMGKSDHEIVKSRRFRITLFYQSKVRRKVYTNYGSRLVLAGEMKQQGPLDLLSLDWLQTSPKRSTVEFIASLALLANGLCQVALTRLGLTLFSWKALRKMFGLRAKLLLVKAQKPLIT